MEAKDYRTLRIRKETQQQLKIVSALRHESMLETLTHLVAQEYERLQRGGKRDAALEKD